MSDEAITTRRFHEGTKHPNGDLLDPRHRYDPRSRPPLVKDYRDGRSIELPAVEPEVGVPALEAIAGHEPISEPHSFDREGLARFLYYSAGVTKRLRMRGGGRMPFRAASCTGALYHVELYLVCGDLPELEAGLYWYHPERHQLTRLRQGDPRPQLAQTAADPAPVRRAPLTVVYTSAYWRNAIKYQARAYRHVFWDGGTLLANSLALANALGWSARPSLAFADNPVEVLLGIEEEPELPICLLPLGDGSEGQLADGEPGSLEAQAQLPEGYRHDWPAIEAVQNATELDAAAQAEEWVNKASAIKPGTRAQSGEVTELPAPAAQAEGRLEEVIRRRGSSRRFRRRPIHAEQLSLLLERSIRGFETDASPRPGPYLAEPYLIVNEVEGLAPGAYRYFPSRQDLALIRSGADRRAAGQLALGQALGADAAVNVYFLADWERILALGERGYRLAQLEGGVLGGNVYLAAYAQGLGATGLTFFDDAVASYCRRDPRETAVLFLVAVGVPG